ncbi:MAG: hypothetical protein ACTSU5_12250 [Promethearchaeota archaeon]
MPIEELLTQLDALIEAKQFIDIYKLIHPIIERIQADSSQLENFKKLVKYLSDRYTELTYSQEERTRDLQGAIQELLSAGGTIEKGSETRERLQFQYRKLLKNEIAKLQHVVVGEVERDRGLDDEVLWSAILNFLNSDPEFFVEKLPALTASFLESGEKDTDPYFLACLERVLDYFPARVLGFCFDLLEKFTREDTDFSPNPLKAAVLLEKVGEFIDIYPEISVGAVQTFLNLASSQNEPVQGYGLAYLQLMEKNQPRSLEEHISGVIDLIPGILPPNQPRAWVFLRDVLDNNEESLLDQIAPSAWSVDPVFLHFSGVLELGISEVTDLVMEVLARLLTKLKERAAAESGGTSDPYSGFYRDVASFFERLAGSMQLTMFSILHFKELLEGLISRPIEVTLEADEPELSKRFQEILAEFRKHLD